MKFVWREMLVMVDKDNGSRLLANYIHSANKGIKEYCETRELIGVVVGLTMIVFGVILRDIVFLLCGVGLIVIEITGPVERAKKNPTQQYWFNYYKELYIYNSLHKNKKTRTFKKYSDWKKHIESDYKELIGSEDFYRCLYDRLRYIRGEKDFFPTAAIPFMILLLTVVYNMDKSSIDQDMVLYLLMISFTVFGYYCSVIEMNHEMYFIEDLMRIIYSEKKL